MPIGHHSKKKKVIYSQASLKKVSKRKIFEVGFWIFWLVFSFRELKKQLESN